MKKLIILIILLITAINCGFFDSEEWAETMENRKEREHKCYRDYKGYFYCKDKYGNYY